MTNQNFRKVIVNPDKYWNLLDDQDKFDILKKLINELYNLHDAVDEDLDKIEKEINTLKLNINS